MPKLEREMLRRWAPFSLATAATVLLVLIFWTVADGLVAPRSLPAPALKSLSSAQLANMGITLSGTAQPPYCGLQGGVAQHGWVGQGSLGCAITRDAAESAAKQGSSTVQVIESALALVTYDRQPRVAGRLMWVVVTQGSPAGTAALWGGTRFTRTSLVLVDAHTAATTPLPLCGSRAPCARVVGPPIRQGPITRPPTLPAAVTTAN